MRFFRIPSFTGIETHRDDADRGSLRAVEGCLPHGPGGVRSGPVWEEVADITIFSDNSHNELTGMDDPFGNSILVASRAGEVHDIQVISKENTPTGDFGANYQVLESLVHDQRPAPITPIGNRMYSFGDGSAEAVFFGQGPAGKEHYVYPDGDLYSHEHARFPNCRFFVQGPNKALFGAGNPDNPLTVYISEPAGLTQPVRDSLHSGGESKLSTVDILGSNASKITALSTRGNQVVVHTDKGCHLLYAPTGDQAGTGYRVEQASATNFSAAVNVQVVAGESGSQNFWLGHDGQIYKDEAAARGAEDKKNFTDGSQASWKSKGVWEKELLDDLSKSFATYDPQSGMYWVFTETDDFLDYFAGEPPQEPLGLQITGIVRDAPDTPRDLTISGFDPDAPKKPEDLVLTFIPDSADTPRELEATIIPDSPNTPGNLTIAEAVPDSPNPVVQLSIPVPRNGPGLLVGALKLPDVGPTDLVGATVLPARGPTRLTDLVSFPENGPESLTGETEAPVSGPDDLSAVYPAPVSGPTDLAGVFPSPVFGPDDLNADVEVPANGPSLLNYQVLIPENGPTNLNESVPVPANGPTSLSGEVVIPDAGPTNLTAGDASTSPSSGPTNLLYQVQVPIDGPTDLTYQVDAPVAGPTDLTAPVPIAGPTDLTGVYDSPWPDFGPTDLLYQVEVPSAGPTNLTDYLPTVPVPGDGPFNLQANLEPIPTPSFGDPVQHIDITGEPTKRKVNLVVIPDLTTEANAYTEIVVYWHAPFTDQNGDGNFNNVDWNALGTPNERVQLVGGVNYSGHTIEIEVPYDDSDTTQNVMAFSARLVLRNAQGTFINNSFETQKSVLNYNPVDDGGQLTPPTAGPTNLTGEVGSDSGGGGTTEFVWTQELLDPYAAHDVTMGMTGIYLPGLNSSSGSSVISNFSAQMECGNDLKDYYPKKLNLGASGTERNQLLRYGTDPTCTPSSLTNPCMTGYFPEITDPESGGRSKMVHHRVWSYEFREFYYAALGFTYMGKRVYSDWDGNGGWQTPTQTHHSWRLMWDANTGGHLNTHQEIWIVFDDQGTETSNGQPGYIAFRVQLHDTNGNPVGGTWIPMKKVDNNDQATQTHNPFGSYNDFLFNTSMLYAVHFGTDFHDASFDRTLMLSQGVQECSFGTGNRYYSHDTSLNGSCAQDLRAYARYDIPNMTVDGVAKTGQQVEQANGDLVEAYTTP